jgi:ABC-type transport system involved in multi-copper enzyme maturation permease subunit
MTEQNQAQNTTADSTLQEDQPNRFFQVVGKLATPVRQLRQNPMVLKEMRSQMRGNRAFIIITVYLLLLSTLIGLIYLGFVSAEETSPTASIRQGLGKTVFGAVVGFELMMVNFLSPALTAGAIASERERQTFDLLRTTLLPAKTLVSGKLISAISFLLILLFISFPLQSLAFLFGGVSIQEVLIALLMLVATAFFFSGIGIFISSFMKSTLASTVISYIVAILVAFGVPVLITIAITFFGIVPQALTNISNFQQTLLELFILTIGYLFVSVNPLGTAISTEIMILQEQNPFYITIPLSNGWNFPVVGPWIAYTLIYFLSSMLLVWISIRIVRRAEN